MLKFFIRKEKINHNFCKKIGRIDKMAIIFLSIAIFAPILIAGLEIVFLQKKEITLRNPVKLNESPSDIAIKTTSGKTNVIVVMSPTCPICRLWVKNELDKTINLLTGKGGLNLIIRMLPIYPTDMETIINLACVNKDERLTMLKGVMSPMGQNNQNVDGKIEPNKDCVKNKKLREELQEAAKRDIMDWKIVGTPSFVIGNKVFVGALSATNILGKTSE